MESISLEKKILQRYNTLHNGRSQELATLRDLQYFLMPAHGTDYDRQADQKGNDRQERDYPLDSIGIDASKKFSSGIYSHTYSEGGEYFGFGYSDVEVEENSEVASFTSELTKTILRKIAASNFSTEYSRFCDYYARLGHGLTYFEYIDKEFHFQNRSVIDCETVHDSLGKLTGVYRKYSLTVEQIVDEFGDEKLPEKVKEAFADEKKRFDKLEIIHGVYYNEDYDEKKGFTKNNVAKHKRVKSVYVMCGKGEDDSSQPSLLKDSGFDYFPYVDARYDVVDGHAVGAGHNALPDLRQYDKIVSDFNLGVEFQIFPPIATTDDELYNTSTIQPRQIIKLSAMAFENAQLPFAKLPVMENVPELIPWLDRTEMKIRGHFHNDTFLYHRADEQKTATEASLLNGEKLELILPISSSVNTGYHDSILTTMAEVVMMYDEVGQPPDLVKNKKLRLDYYTQLGARIGELQNERLLRAVQKIVALLTAIEETPLLSAFIPVEKAVRLILQNENVDASLIRTEHEIEEYTKKIQDAQNDALQNQRNHEQTLAVAGRVDPNIEPQDGSIAQRAVG